MKRTKLKSGQEGWIGLIRDNYGTYSEFEYFSRGFNLHERLGYKTPKELWDANPIVQGGINASDFEKVKYSPKRHKAIWDAANRISLNIHLRVDAISSSLYESGFRGIPISKKELRQFEKDIEQLKLTLKMLSQ